RGPERETRGGDARSSRGPSCVRLYNSRGRPTMASGGAVPRCGVKRVRVVPAPFRRFLMRMRLLLSGVMVATVGAAFLVEACGGDAEAEPVADAGVEAAPREASAPDTGPADTG